jgi:hypothetical protein
MGSRAWRRGVQEPTFARRGGRSHAFSSTKRNLTWTRDQANNDTATQRRTEPEDCPNKRLKPDQPAVSSVMDRTQQTFENGNKNVSTQPASNHRTASQVDPLPGQEQATVPNGSGPGTDAFRRTPHFPEVWFLLRGQLRLDCCQSDDPVAGLQHTNQLLPHSHLVPARFPSL